MPIDPSEFASRAYPPKSDHGRTMADVDPFAARRELHDLGPLISDAGVHQDANTVEREAHVLAASVDVAGRSWDKIYNKVGHAMWTLNNLAAVATGNETISRKDSALRIAGEFEPKVGPPALRSLHAQQTELGAALSPEGARKYLAAYDKTNAKLVAYVSSVVRLPERPNDPDLLRKIGESSRALAESRAAERAALQMRPTVGSDAGAQSSTPRDIPQTKGARKA